MNLEKAQKLMEEGTPVRVWNVQQEIIFCEGLVIAYSQGPMICIRDEDGVKHWHPTSLPMDERIWNPL